MLTYVDRLPLWKWHETGDLLQGLGICYLGGMTFVAFVVAVVSHRAFAVGGWAATGVFGGVVLFALALQERRTTSPSARRVAAAVRVLLISIGWIVFVAAALALATLVVLLGTILATACRWF